MHLLHLLFFWHESHCSILIGNDFEHFQNGIAQNKSCEIKNKERAKLFLLVQVGWIRFSHTFSFYIRRIKKVKHSKKYSIFTSLVFFISLKHHRNHHHFAGIFICGKLDKFLRYACKYKCDLAFYILFQSNELLL